MKFTGARFGGKSFTDNWMFSVTALALLSLLAVFSYNCGRSDERALLLNGPDLARTAPVQGGWADQQGRMGFAHVRFADEATSLRDDADAIRIYGPQSVRVDGIDVRNYSESYGSGIVIGESTSSRADPGTVFHLALLAANHETVNGPMYARFFTSRAPVFLPIWPITPETDDSRGGAPFVGDDVSVLMATCKQCPRVSPVHIASALPPAGSKVEVVGFSEGRNAMRVHRAILDRGLAPTVFGDRTEWLYCPRCNHGDSGGGVFDGHGDLIGIMTFKDTFSVMDDGKVRYLKAFFFAPLTTVCTVLRYSTTDDISDSIEHGCKPYEQRVADAGGALSANSPEPPRIVYADGAQFYGDAFGL